MTTAPSPLFRVFGRDPVPRLGLFRAALDATAVFVLAVPEHVSAEIIAASTAAFGPAEVVIVIREKLVPMILGFTEAGLALVLAFGVNLTGGQLAAAMLIATAVTSFATRTQVTAPTDADGTHVAPRKAAA
ncbi:hypothetical protein HFP72_02650 [Nocardiopsis sp. ARC36]